jgi:hypothetical protein
MFGLRELTDMPNPSEKITFNTRIRINTFLVLIIFKLYRPLLFLPNKNFSFKNHNYTKKSLM